MLLPDHFSKMLAVRLATPKNCILHVTFQPMFWKNKLSVALHVCKKSQMYVTQRLWWIVALWFPVIWTKNGQTPLGLCGKLNFRSGHYLSIPLWLCCRYRFNTAGSCVKMFVFVCVCVVVYIAVYAHRSMCCLCTHIHVCVQLWAWLRHGCRENVLYNAQEQTSSETVFCIFMWFLLHSIYKNDFWLKSWSRDKMHQIMGGLPPPLNNFLGETQEVLGIFTMKPYIWTKCRFKSSSLILFPSFKEMRNKSF